MPTNSLYLFGSKSAESNTSIYLCFGLIINIIQWFLQKYHIWFLSQIFEGSAYYTKSLRLHLLKVIWCPYDILVLPLLKLMRYVRSNYRNDFSMFLLLLFINLLEWFTVFEIIVVVVPQHWAVMALLSNSWRVKERDLPTCLIRLSLYHPVERNITTN